MSYDPDVNAAAVMNSYARGAHWLIELYFTTGTLYYTTAPVTIDSPNGHSYIGTNGNVWIEQVQENVSSSIDTINISAGIADKSLLAALTTSIETYRNRLVRLHLQFLNEKFAPIGMPVHRWTGIMNPIKVIREKPDESNGNTFGRIELPCQRIGMAKSRSRLGLRVTHEQQIKKYPGDLGLEYIKPLVLNPPPWLTVSFQKV